MTYLRRLVPPLEIVVHEISPAKRSKTKSIPQLKTQEGQELLNRIPEHSHVVALDEQGKTWTSVELAQQLQYWLRLGKPTALLIGGPDGLAKECLQRAQQCWSLSSLTLPHGLARLLVVEQLYRAQSILANHPYHRQ